MWSPTVPVEGLRRVMSGAAAALAIALLLACATSRSFERGVSFAAFGPDGRARVTGYASCLFAPEPRFRIRATPGA